MYNCAVIWSEETGEVADFIDTIIENMEDEYEDDDNNEIEHEEKSAIEKMTVTLLLGERIKRCLMKKLVKELLMN